MPTITLNWTLNTNGNTVNQRASKRAIATTKHPSESTVFSSTGFTPPNDLATSISSASFTAIGNVIYEMKVENICSLGGPTINNNGIRQGIKFSCLPVNFGTVTDNTTQISVNVNAIGTDIAQVIFVLTETNGGAIVESKTVAALQSGNTIANFIGLNAGTSYTITTSYQATVNGALVTSAACPSVTQTTGSASCVAPGALTIS